MIKSLDNISSWENIFNQNNNGNQKIIFKTSHRCGVSHFVKMQFNSWVKELPNDTKLDIYEIDVVFQRDISNRIAEDTQVRHQSPQVIWINSDGSVKCNLHHGEISVRNLSDCLSGNFSTRKGFFSKIFG